MNIAQFNNQPDDVRQKVLDACRDWNVDCHNWGASITNDFEVELGEIGIEVKRCQWSGFWSQGDGASFNGCTSNMLQLCQTIPDLQKFADIYQLDQVSMDWASHGTYSHEHTLHFELMDHRYEEDSDEPLTRMRDKLITIETPRLEELERAVIDWVKDQCRKLYDQLQAEYEHLTSDEQVLEALEANEALEEKVLEAREALGYEF